MYVKECLRMASPLPVLFARIAVQDFECNGIKIKKGTEIRLAPMANS
jgi:cytochrome P450